MKNKGLVGCLNNKNFCKDDEEINNYDINSNIKQDPSEIDKKTKSNSGLYIYEGCRYVLSKDGMMLREKRDGSPDLVYQKECEDVLKYGKKENK